MKFHCDRCKTKYSISDDRVRGKILKIRCKNCSAVITVREAGAEAAKGADKSGGPGKDGGVPTPSQAPDNTGAQAAGQKALAGAFKQSVTEANTITPGGSGSSAPPVSLEAEWYVSVDGHQEGPFSLQEARAWVQGKTPDDELYCWSEGYDDWLSTDKVSHFRSLRRAPSGPAGGAENEMTTVADEPGNFDEDTPLPLFAATMQAVESQTPGASSEADIIPPKPATGPFDSIPEAKVAKHAAAPPIPMAAAHAADGLVPAPDADGQNLDFEIGEASRVVDLPALLAARGNAPARPVGSIHKNNALPGTDGPQSAALGRGSGQEGAIGERGASTGPARSVGSSTPFDGSAALDVDAGTAKPRKKRRGLHIPLIATALLIGGVAIAMILMLTSDDGGSQVVRGTVGGSGNLGHSNRGEFRTSNGSGQVETAPEAVVNSGGKTNPGIRKDKFVPKNNPPNGTTLPELPTRDPDDEVDLSGGSGAVATGPLDGNDLMKVYRKNQIAIKMCYERELKKNPLLKLPKTWVDIKVGLDGRVSGVSIPSLQGTPLGNCMRSRIARWKFRKTTELFSSRFPVVFGS